MFWTEDWKWITNLPEEIKKNKPHRASQYNVDIFALWYWKEYRQCSAKIYQSHKH